MNANENNVGPNERLLLRALGVKDDAIDKMSIKKAKKEIQRLFNVIKFKQTKKFSQSTDKFLKMLEPFVVGIDKKNEVQ